MDPKDQKTPQPASKPDQPKQDAELPEDNISLVPPQSDVVSDDDLVDEPINKQDELSDEQSAQTSEVDAEKPSDLVSESFGLPEDPKAPESPELSEKIDDISISESPEDIIPKDTRGETLDEKPWPTSATATPSVLPTNSVSVASDSPAQQTKDASLAPGDDDDDLLGAEPQLPSQSEMGHPEGIIPPVPMSSSDKKPSHRWIFMTIVAVLVLAVAGGAYAAYRASKKETAKELPRIKVGVMMAFTGGSSSMGYGAMKGIQLAKKQLGAENIEITQMDSKCDPKAAADAVKKLIAQHVAAIIGEGCSSASVAALPAANNSKTVMISPSASSTALSIPDDYFFRVVPPDTFQGEYIAQAIYDKGIRTVAVFYTNEPYGTSMNKVFQERFEALGGKVVATASGEPDVIDLKAQMTELKTANAQAIFFAPNSVVSGTAAMKIGRELGIKAPYYGADILYNTTIIDDAPTATDGLTITSFPTGSKSFKQALMNMNDQVNEQLYAAPQAYDAFRAIYIATQRGASTGEAIKKELPNISFDGVSARIKFDQNGEISDKSYKYDLLQIKSGSFVTVE